MATKSTGSSAQMQSKDFDEFLIKLDDKFLYAIFESKGGATSHYSEPLRKEIAAEAKRIKKGEGSPDPKIDRIVMRIHEEFSSHQGLLHAHSFAFRRAGRLVRSCYLAEDPEANLNMSVQYPPVRAGRERFMNENFRKKWNSGTLTLLQRLGKKSKKMLFKGNK